MSVFRTKPGSLLDKCVCVSMCHLISHNFTLDASGHANP